MVRKRKQDYVVVTVITSLTDGLVVVTSRVGHERKALAVRGRVTRLLVVLCIKYIIEISEPRKCF
jgi:hypothetical protein